MTTSQRMPRTSRNRREPLRKRLEAHGRQLIGLCGLPLALTTALAVPARAGDVVKYFVTDAVGNVRVVTDEQGKGSRFRVGCLAVWNLSRVYPPTGRGEQCTSSDAAGYPIAPLLFTADEVAAGASDHAIRFILPNARIRKGEYVHPATHGTRAASGPPDAPPYGARLRLRADYPMDRLPNAGARVVARAMQKHGILLADGGNIALTARSDRSTLAKWAGLLGPRDLEVLRPADFEWVEAGKRIPLTNDCMPNPWPGSFHEAARCSE